MFSIILATTPTNGIGYENKLPWHCPEELKMFKDRTIGSVLLVGYKTYMSMPELYDRTVYVISTKKRDDKTFFRSFESAMNHITKKHKNTKIYIIGGSSVYNYVFEKYNHLIERIYLSIMKNEYKCDSYISFDIKKYDIDDRKDYTDFTHYILKNKEILDENQYLNVLKNVLYNGTIREGRNGETKSVFVSNMKFDLRHSFPLLTTKKMFTRGIIEELLFFIRGDTDSKILEQKNVNIWKLNTERKFLDSVGFKDRQEGIMGPMYGYNFRFFGAEYDDVKACPKTEGIDQLKNVIELIKKDPTSRRIIMTSYNPMDVHLSVLYPCHSLSLQFCVTDGYLDMFCFNRSADLFLGVPFNIASSSLLLLLIAKVTKLIPRYFILTLGDTHIYKEHYELAELQLSRKPYNFPKLDVKDIETLEEMEKMIVDDFKIFDYKCHDVIKTEMKA